MNLATRASRRHKEIASFSVARRRPPDGADRRVYAKMVWLARGAAYWHIEGRDWAGSQRSPFKDSIKVHQYIRDPILFELVMERSCPLALIVPKRTRRGIPSKRRPFSCIHAINTNPPLPPSPPYNTFFFTERKSLFTSLLPSHLSLYSHLFTHWK